LGAASSGALMGPMGPTGNAKGSLAQGKTEHAPIAANTESNHRTPLFPNLVEAPKSKMVASSD